MRVYLGVSRGSSLLRRAAATAAVAVLSALAAAAPAEAQLPPTPQVPRVELPQPVAEALTQGIDTVVPLVGEAAIQLRPVATAGGFALRVPCAALGGASFVLALGSSIVVLPIPAGVFIGPALVFCSGAFEEGPADPVFAQLDDAVGATLQEQSRPVLDQLGSAIAPARPSLDEGCGVIRIFSNAPKQAPPPLHRYDLVALVCG